MNKMADVAKLLGRKLDEEFIIQSPNDYKCKCKLTNEGLLVYISASDEWVNRNGYLYDLISGKYEIKTLAWKAGESENYFRLAIRNGEIYPECVYELNPIADNITYNNGLMCKTSEQAEELSNLLIKTAREFQGFDEEEV